MTHPKHVDHSESPSKDSNTVGRPGIRHSTSMASSWWQRFGTSVFPFLVFEHPEHRPLQSTFHVVESFLTLIGNSFYRGSPSSSVRVPPLLKRAVELWVMMCGSLVAIFIIVYICFSFNSEDQFPTVGASLRYFLLVRNIILILLMHYLCFSVCVPNFERIRTLRITSYFDDDPELAYVGVFHTLRRWTSLRSTFFKMRWFTTFMSDSLLLAITYVGYFIYGVLLICYDAEVSRFLSALSDLYRSSLTCGFIIYTLEFAPIVSHKRSIFNAICLFMIATQISDFFLFVFDKQNQGAVQRAFGAGAQLFITHSSVLLSAIIWQHHQHTQLSPDFPLGSVWKLLLVLCFAAAWLVYAIYRELYGHEDSGTMSGNWIPLSYPYVLWGVSVVGGLVCLAAAARYCYTISSDISNEPNAVDKFSNVPDISNEPNDVDKVSNENGISNEPNIVDNLSSEPNDIDKISNEPDVEESESEFDITLIVITFSVATVYYASELFGAFSHHAWWTLLYWGSTPLAPIGLGVLAATFWWKPPTRPNLILYLALTMAGILLMSMETAEDCHLNSDTPACCEYPWLPDTNAELRDPNGMPGCGTVMIAGSCAAPYTNVSSNLFSNLVPLTFTSVVDVTQAVNVVVSNGANIVWTAQLTNIADLVYATTCQDQTVTTAKATYTPGCYGAYLYFLPEVVVSACDPQVAACTVAVSTLNCAYAESEALVFSIIDLTKANLSKIEFSFTPVEGKDIIDSNFYTVFKLVGMAALLECFFTLFGVLLKLVFLCECQSARLARTVLTKNEIHQNSK